MGAGLEGGCRAMVDGEKTPTGRWYATRGRKVYPNDVTRRPYRCFSFYRYDTSKTKSHLEASFIVSPPRHFRLATVKPKPVYTLHPAPSKIFRPQTRSSEHRSRTTSSSHSSHSAREPCSGVCTHRAGIACALLYIKTFEIRRREWQTTARQGPSWGAC